MDWATNHRLGQPGPKQRATILSGCTMQRDWEDETYYCQWCFKPMRAHWQARITGYVVHKSYGYCTECKVRLERAGKWKSMPKNSDLHVSDERTKRNMLSLKRYLDKRRERSAINYRRAKR